METPAAAVREVDRSIARFVITHRTPTLSSLVGPFGHRPGVWIFLPLAVAAICFAARSVRPALLAGASVSLGLLVAEGLKLFTPRRQAPSTVLSPIYHPFMDEFPSGHATAAFAVCTALGFAAPRWRWPLLALAAMIAVGRVYVGAHYASDVVAGAMIGIAAGALAEYFRRHLRAAL
jgi:membrane-associated phospholipid phosphatase